MEKLVRYSTFDIQIEKLVRYSTFDFDIQNRALKVSFDIKNLILGHFPNANEGF